MALCIMTTVNELHVEKIAETERRKRLQSGAKKDARSSAIAEEVEKLEARTDFLKVSQHEGKVGMLPRVVACVGSSLAEMLCAASTAGVAPDLELFHEAD